MNLLFPLYLLCYFCIWLAFSAFGSLLALTGQCFAILAPGRFEKRNERRASAARPSRMTLTLSRCVAVVARAAPKRERKRVVIVGGGFAGALIAKKLERQCDTVLVDVKSYFEFTPSVLRVLTEPNHVSNIQIQHSRYLDLAVATVLHDRVTELAPDLRSLRLASGRTLAFDYCVLATGSSYAGSARRARARPSPPPRRPMSIASQRPSNARTSIACFKRRAATRWRRPTKRSCARSESC